LEEEMTKKDIDRIAIEKSVDAELNRLRKQLSRREFLKFLGITYAASTFLAACAQATETESAIAVPTEPQAEAVKDTIIVGVPSTVQTLDTEGTAMWHAASTEATRNLYDPFVDYKYEPNEEGILVPQFQKEEYEGILLESWEVAGDELTWTMKLKEGIISEYGNELTTEDIKWTTDRGFALKSGGNFNLNVSGVMSPEDVKVIDKYVFSFTTQEPNPLFMLARAQYFIVVFDSTEAKKHATSDDPWALEWAAKNGGGHAPYRIESWTPGKEFVLAAREDYFRGPARIKRVVFREIPASSNRLASLEAGEIDIAKQLSAREREQLKDKPGVKIAHYLPGNQYTWMVVNTQVSPFDTQPVRRAIAHSIPHQEIIDSVYFGDAVQMKGVVSPIFFGATEEFWQYDTDLDKAKAYLEEAGLSDGFSMEMLYEADKSEMEQTALLIVGKLREIGVEVTLDKQTSPIFEERKQKHEFSCFLSNTDQPWMPDVQYASLYFGGEAQHLNFADFHDEELNEAFSNVIYEMDPDTRTIYLKKMQEVLMREIPYMPIVLFGEAVSMRDDIHGYAWRLENAMTYYEMWRE
jgi:peptide/nickel transport system substrate-binding protein